METPAAPSAGNLQSKLGPAATGFQVSRYSFYALGVLTLVNFLNYIDRQILPSVAPLMAIDLHLSDTEIGAMEASLLLSFTVLAPLFGRLGDRYSRTKLMAVAAVIWSLATGLTGVMDHFPIMPGSVHVNLPLIQFSLELSGVAIVLCLVRAVVGVGESSYSTITPSLIADYFPPERRATALGVFQAAIPMGFALGYVIGVVLAHFFGWRMAFMIVGLPGLITSWFVWRLREPVRGASEHKVESSNPAADSEAAANLQTQVAHESWLRTSWRILRTRDWLLSTAGYTALTFVLGAFGTWANILLVRDKGLTVTQAGITLGLVTLLAGAAGTFGGGWLADRLITRRQNAYFMVCAASSALGIIPVFVVLATGKPWIFIPAIFLSVFFLFINNAPFHAILINSVPPLVRATAVALNIVIIHIMGDVISRFGVGVLSDSIQAGGLSFMSSIAGLLGIEAQRQHLTAALLVVPISLLISSLLFLWGAISQKTAAS
ncbi:MAG TPA: MFS transporter [Pyrinomonadaceae bacterium]|nr:MFS transporter [Pyrinomonadaceae bacterium]